MGMTLNKVLGYGLPVRMEDGYFVDSRFIDKSSISDIIESIKIEESFILGN